MSKFDVAVTQRKDAPEDWSVEAIETEGDGDCYVTIFSGPEAEMRAREYASFKYRT